MTILVSLGFSINMLPHTSFIPKPKQMPHMSQGDDARQIKKLKTSEAGQKTETGFLTVVYTFL